MNPNLQTLQLKAARKLAHQRATSARKTLATAGAGSEAAARIYRLLLQAGADTAAVASIPAAALSELGGSRTSARCHGGGGGGDDGDGRGGSGGGGSTCGVDGEDTKVGMVDVFPIDLAGAEAAVEVAALETEAAGAPPAPPPHPCSGQWRWELDRRTRAGRGGRSAAANNNNNNTANNAASNNHAANNSNYKSAANDEIAATAAAFRPSTEIGIDIATRLKPHATVPTVAATTTTAASHWTAGSALEYHWTTSTTSAPPSQSAAAAVDVTDATAVTALLQAAVAEAATVAHSPRRVNLTELLTQTFYP